MRKTKKKKKKEPSKKTRRVIEPQRQVFLQRTEKKFGRGTLSFANDDAEFIERLPLGIAPVDRLIGGGLPMGKVTMFRGPESGTKTTLAILACRQYLERFPDRLAVYVDTEEKYPYLLVKRLGIKRESFSRASLETSEKTIDFLAWSLRQESVGILVLDSLAGMVPRIEIDAPMEDQQQGVAAREINKLLRKMVHALRVARLEKGWSPTVILINQERYKIGVRFGNPITLPGGEGQKYFVSLSLRLRKLKIRKEDGLPEDAPMVKISAVVAKHSFGPEGKDVEYLFAMEDFRNLKTGDAMDEDFLWRMGNKLDLIEEIKLMDGDSSRAALERREEFYDRLKEAVLLAGAEKSSS